MRTSLRGLRSNQLLDRPYLALMADWVECEDPDTGRSESRKKKIESASELLFDAFHDMTSAEGKLLLLGETTAQKELKEYASCAQKFYDDAHVDNKQLTIEKLKEHMIGMRDKREALLLALSQIYKGKGT